MDIKNSNRYKNAEVIKGIIIENLGNQKILKHNSSRLSQKYRHKMYQKYLVYFDIDGNTYVQELLLRNGSLSIEDVIDIHVIKEDGKYILVDDIGYKRLKAFKRGLIFVVVLAVILITLEFVSW